MAVSTRGNTVEAMLALTGTRRRLPGTRSLLEADIARVLALLPVAAALAASGTWASVLNAFVHAVLAVMGAQMVFTRLRGRPMETGGLATAAAFALLLPAGTPVLHVVLGAVVGVVLGELIFGGRGWGFLNPAVVGLTFVYFSDPGAATPAQAVAPWAAGAGGALLLALGLAEWRISLAAFATLGAIAAVTGQAPEAFLWSGSVLFTVLFLAADPTGAPSSRGARWLFGALVAVLVPALAAGPGTPNPRVLVFALMLSAIFAPLLDSIVLALHGLRERRAQR
jgi:Na+-transporting NADH:ubiquinone oxidoreductase subunit B